MRMVAVPIAAGGWRSRPRRNPIPHSRSNLKQSHRSQLALTARQFESLVLQNQALSPHPEPWCRLFYAFPPQNAVFPWSPWGMKWPWALFASAPPCTTNLKFLVSTHDVSLLVWCLDRLGSGYAHFLNQVPFASLLHPPNKNLPFINWNYHITLPYS